METKQLQQELFKYLKDSLPPHLSLTDELCNLLNLSADKGVKFIPVDPYQPVGRKRKEPLLQYIKR